MNLGKKRIDLVVFGVGGSLSQTKLLPAVSHLLNHHPDWNLEVVGVDKRKTTFSALGKKFYFLQLDFAKKQDFDRLKKFLHQKNGSSGGTRRQFFYLATWPKFFLPIVKNLKKQRLIGKKDCLIFEKPFGQNLQAATKLENFLSKNLVAQNIFRVDHYLNKELVQNLLTVRQVNRFFEPLWNKKHLDHVQIVIVEKEGVAGRGLYYDRYGALKDVFQNHLLQLLALVAGPAKNSFDKTSVFKSVKKPVSGQIVFGQYGGYQKEEGVAEESLTETLVAAKLFVDQKKWQGVPFYLLTGKKMAQKKAFIYLQFKSKNHFPNYLVFEIQPREGFYFSLNVKKPGQKKIKKVTLDFCQRCLFGPHSPQAYENLLKDIFAGRHDFFVTRQETLAAWHLTEKLAALKKKVSVYQPGVLPLKVSQLLGKDKREWFL